MLDFSEFSAAAVLASQVGESSSMSSGSTSYFQQTDSRLTSLTASPLLSQAQSPSLVIQRSPMQGGGQRGEGNNFMKNMLTCNQTANLCTPRHHM
jgi:hypothetical protein